MSKVDVIFFLAVVALLMSLVFSSGCSNLFEDPGPYIVADKFRYRRAGFEKYVLLTTTGLRCHVDAMDFGRAEKGQKFFCGGSGWRGNDPETEDKP